MCVNFTFEKTKNLKRQGLEQIGFVQTAINYRSWFRKRLKGQSEILRRIYFRELRTFQQF